LKRVWASQAVPEPLVQRYSMGDSLALEMQSILF
jgi:hypothetical protein